MKQVKAQRSSVGARPRAVRHIRAVELICTSAASQYKSNKERREERGVETDKKYKDPQALLEK